MTYPRRPRRVAAGAQRAVRVLYLGLLPSALVLGLLGPASSPARADDSPTPTQTGISGALPDTDHAKVVKL
ncbi:hypothetical protein ACWDAZ_34860 [Streptomyces sp. NPDC001215]